MKKKIFALGDLTFIALLFCSNAAAEESKNAEDLSLDQLVGTKIYTASKKEEDSSASPSATYVITADDLKQMGVRHVADAFRTVPGLQVAKISSNKWMVASRGFGEQFSNKLLVLLDGRPLLTNLFSGVFWFQQDIPISDIKQIEVIRGAGATLWGSNAVNGVINIITKSTRDTLGTNITTTLGVADNGDYQKVIEAQYGKKINDLGTVRGTLKLQDDPTYDSATNKPSYNDSWKHGSLNFRFDSPQDVEKSYTVTGAVFNSESDQTYTIPTLTSPFFNRSRREESSRGGYISGSAAYDTSANSSTTVQTYLDYTAGEYADYKPTFVNGSISLQRNFLLFNNWETIAGSEYKFTADSIENSSVMISDPSHYMANYWDAFLQTKIPLIEKELFLTVGNKIEANSYTPILFSPNVKLGWEPDPLFMTWLSWSRAHRIPSRNTTSLTTYSNGTPFGYVALLPNPNFKSEDVEEYEAGIRVNPLPGLHLDTSIFLNSYDNLRTFNQGPPAASPVFIPLYIGNSGIADNRGVEISATYQTSPALRLNAGYAYTDLNFKGSPGLTDTLFLNSDKKWAKNTVTGRAAYSIREDLTFNTSAYYYSAQPAIKIPAYTKVDSNISWSVIPGMNVIGGVDNITDNRHPEYSPSLYGETTEVPRLYYVTLELSL